MPRTSPVTTRSIPLEWWSNRSLFREPIIKSAEPLAKKIARYYSGGSIDRFEDILSVAYEYLNQSIDTYEPDKASFSTHAVTRMRSGIRHYLRDNSPMPRVWFEDYYRVDREAKKINKLRQQYGYPALSLKDVAMRLGVLEWERIVVAMQNPNPIGLVGFEQEYQPEIEDDDLDFTARRDLVSKARTVLFQLPERQRKSIEVWMKTDKRDRYFDEALKVVKHNLEAAV